MRSPIVVVNFKTYPEVCGARGLEIARKIDEAMRETKGSAVIAPQQTDLALIAREAKVPVFAQHLDNAVQGSTTGYVTPEGVKAAGCVGTLLNHSEHRIRGDELELIVERCRKAGLKTIVCSNTVAVCKACTHFAPDFIAIEPPELIGGDLSVTSADPKIVESAVEAVKGIDPKVKVLCGAGVKTGTDVKKAIELGADGVLLASGIVKAKDPKAVMIEMLRAL
ncbi:MAG: triose-phosphate isomerase [Euryarchaeota archaeon]|nr:triose-phosphate isomerase [Euryarchaeota archaeon]